MHKLVSSTNPPYSIVGEWGVRGGANTLEEVLAIQMHLPWAGRIAGIYQKYAKWQVQYYISKIIVQDTVYYDGNMVVC